MQHPRDIQAQLCVIDWRTCWRIAELYHHHHVGYNRPTQLKEHKNRRQTVKQHNYSLHFIDFVKLSDYSNYKQVQHTENFNSFHALCLWASSNRTM